MDIVQQITNSIIRPARQRYHMNRLGPKDFNVRSVQGSIFSIRREDSCVVNDRKQKIFYSFYRNSGSVYLHANNGSRVEGLHYLDALLSHGLNACLMDLSGSGLSDGEYVTLGPNQAVDLDYLYQDMKYKKGIESMVLWGRSMGACTALRYAQRFPHNVAAMILDSPFKDLRKLTKEIASEKTGIPKILFEPIISLVDSELLRKIGHRFQQYKMKAYIQRMSATRVIPALFLCSQNDNLVKPHHVEKLYSRYPGWPNQHKFLSYMGNRHHENRDDAIVNKCIAFIFSFVGARSGALSYNSMARFNMQERDERDHQQQNTKFSFKSNQVVVRPQTSFFGGNKDVLFCFSGSTGSIYQMELPDRNPKGGKFAKVQPNRQSNKKISLNNKSLTQMNLSVISSTNPRTKLSFKNNNYSRDRLEKLEPSSSNYPNMAYEGQQRQLVQQSILLNPNSKMDDQSYRMRNGRENIYSRPNITYPAEHGTLTGNQIPSGLSHMPGTTQFPPNPRTFAQHGYDSRRQLGPTHRTHDTYDSRMNTTNVQYSSPPVSANRYVSEGRGHKISLSSNRVPWAQGIPM